MLSRDGVMHRGVYSGESRMQCTNISINIMENIRIIILMYIGSFARLPI